MKKSFAIISAVFLCTLATGTAADEMKAADKMMKQEQMTGKSDMQKKDLKKPTSQPMKKDGKEKGEMKKSDMK